MASKVLRVAFIDPWGSDLVEVIFTDHSRIEMSAEQYEALVNWTPEQVALKR